MLRRIVMILGLLMSLGAIGTHIGVNHDRQPRAFLDSETWVVISFVMISCGVAIMLLAGFGGKRIIIKT